MSKGKLFVISGASGVGKSTVLRKVLDARQDLQFSVSATTRPPRPGEIDGVNYYFVTREQFLDMIARDEFVEYDEHNATLYGTPWSQLENKLKLGNVILDIEPVGAGNVRKKRPDAILIFVKAPSMEELEHRLRGRGDTSDEQMKMRLERAVWEQEQIGWYDHVVVNDQVDACAEKILNIIAESCVEE
ncbi:MAG: guanylate kinase [Oscillospiraceae bacterium]|nr:guanylate kinase [Oscillospiraceae bacterium]